MKAAGGAPRAPYQNPPPGYRKVAGECCAHCRHLSPPDRWYECRLPGYGGPWFIVGDGIEFLRVCDSFEERKAPTR